MTFSQFTVLKQKRQMNKVIAILILLLTTLPSFCQKRNAKGQKVVERITVQLKEEDAPFITIKFSYDRDLSMNGILFKSNFSKIVWKKQGNTISRTLYDEKGNVDKNYHYSYVIRDDGMIGQLISDNVGIDGSILRYRYYFDYTTDERLCKISQRHFYYPYRQTPYEFSDRYIERFGWDRNGNIFAADLYAYEWKKEVPKLWKVNWSQKEYGNLKNDTNIDFLYLHEGICNADLFEMATPWINCHSNNLITYDKKSGIYYDYTFSENGNLVKCTTYKLYSIYGKKYVEYVINIYYLN